MKNNTLEIRKAIGLIEAGLRRFKLRIKVTFINKMKPKGINITKLQENILHYFQNYSEYIILLIDKNLGPCIINREDYIY